MSLTSMMIMTMKTVLAIMTITDLDLAVVENLRLLVSKAGFGAETLREFRSIPGGFLAQDRDQKKINPKQFEVATERQPTDLEWRSMLFGWRVVRHVKSNDKVLKSFFLC